MSQLRDSLVRTHADELPGRVRRTDLGGERRELEPDDASRVERFGHGERPVPEVVLRRDELDVDEAGREPAQREHGLEPCDAAAGDHDTVPAVEGWRRPRHEPQCRGDR